MKYAVALSGGVDSASTLALLKDSGHEVRAFTMKLYNDDLKNSHIFPDSCFGVNKKKDIEQCKEICNILDVPFTIIDLSKEFNGAVLQPFQFSYAQGITPNPCVMCNDKIKFDLFPKKIKEMYDYDYFVTGHYSNVVVKDDHYYLKRIDNDKKDQTYFLWKLLGKQEVLRSFYSPLGKMFTNKDDVRTYARNKRIPVSDKKDSMSFAEGRYQDFFKSDSPLFCGYFIHNDENIKPHDGIFRYTVGQRARISGLKEKLYVRKIDAESGNIYVDTLDNIVTDKVYLDRRIFIGSPLFNAYMSGEYYGDKPLYMKLKQEGSLIEIDTIYGFPKLCFVLNKKVILTPGQSVVIYDEEGLLIAGGII